MVGCSVKYLKILFFLLFSGLVLSLPAAQADETLEALSTSSATVEIRLENSPASTAILPWSLRISGLWPTDCLPTLESVNVEGNDIRIVTRNQKTLCLQHPTSFNLIVNPAAAVGRSLLDLGVYRVSFYAANGLHAPLMLSGFALINTGSAVVKQGIEPESGFWWPQKNLNYPNTAPSMGFNLELQGTTLVVSTLSYNDKGEPVWYFGSGKLAGRTAHIPLLHLRGPTLFGQGDAILFPQGGGALTVDLEFHSTAQATAWFTRSAELNHESALEVRSVSLARLPFANEPAGIVWQGEWIFVPDNPTQSPQRLHLDNLLNQNDQAFILLDNQTGYSMKCDRNMHQKDLPPTLCTLENIHGTAIAKFNTIAISHLEGSTTDNYRAQMIRLPQ